MILKPYDYDYELQQMKPKHAGISHPILGINLDKQYFDENGIVIRPKYYQEVIRKHRYFDFPQLTNDEV